MSLAEPVLAAQQPDTLRKPLLRSQLSGRFLRSELAMIFRRRRNIAILTVLALIPVVIAIAVKLTSHTGRGNGPGDGGALFNNITDNGVFVALATMLVVLPLFLPMAVSVVSGETISGEANTGTLRYLLTVPVGRTRLVAVKYLALVVWSLACTLVVALSGTIIGLILFGGGDIITLSGTTASFGDGLYRLFLVVCYVTVMVSAVAAIGIFVSTLTEVPIAAMATTLALTITSQVLDAVPQLDVIHGWLPSHYWLRFSDLLRDPIQFDRAQQGVLVALAYIAACLLLAWARFSNKDVTS
jgi:ABC-2 type transport system permease protein